MNKNKKRKWLFLLIASVIFTIWLAWGNIALEINEYKIISENLPESFVGFRIAQVSDLHNDEFGKDNKNLLSVLEIAEPDIIVMTGDIVDSYQTDVEVSLHFIEEAVKIAPCYYVTGNHESRLSKAEYLTFETTMENYGVEILHDEVITMERDGEYIFLGGLDDPSFVSKYGVEDYNNSADRIEKLFTDSGVKILLSHRPELFQTYVEAGVELVFSGHAHGGQFRFPFIGGLIAPNQGFFPEYDEGMFKENETTMVVSRGIGNSLFPLRFNNPPEIIVVELTR